MTSESCDGVAIRGNATNSSGEWRARFRAIGLLACCFVLAVAQACGNEDPVADSRRLLSEGNADAAVELLREVLEDRRDDPAVLFLYGKALSIVGRPSLAEWPLRKAMESEAWRVPAAVQVAYGATASHSFDEAIRAATVALESEPDHLEALLLRANAYVDSRRFASEALEDTDRLLELAPENVRAYRPRVLALLDLERFEEAGEVLEQLGKLIEQGHGDDKTTMWHCATMAIFASDGGDLELAEERWDGCIERFPSHESVVIPAVEYFDGQRRVADSVRILRRAFELDRSSRNRYWVALAARLRLLGEEGEALELMRSAPLEEVDPRERARRWIELADYHKQTGDAEGVIRAAEQAIEGIGATPRTHPDLFFATAEMHVRAGNQDRALEIAESLRVEAHRRMIEAAVAHARKQYSEALAGYEEVGRLWPDNPFARYHAGRVALTLGKIDRAIEEFRHSVRISPSETDAPLRVAEILAARGEYRPALEALRQRRGPWSEAAELLTQEIFARSSGVRVVERALQRLASEHPGAYAKAVGRVVAALVASGDDEAARQILAGVPAALWSHPTAAPAIRARVRLADSVEAIAEAGRLIEALLMRDPTNAALHEVDAYRLLRAGAEESRVRAAIDRALEPDDAFGLAWLTRAQALESEPASERIGDLERAATTVPIMASEEFVALCAELTAGDSDRSTRVAELLERRLEAFPTDAHAALARAELALASRDFRGARSWARRAEQLGLGEGGRQLLQEVDRLAGGPQPI